MNNSLSLSLGAPNVNSGYIGYSMSLRALEAYEDGEMPKSKWTKKAMLGAIYELIEDEYEINPDEFCYWIDKTMKKDEIFARFFMYSSWHHTSKYFNPTDFYSIDNTDTLAIYDLWNLDNNQRQQLTQECLVATDIQKHASNIQEQIDVINMEIGSLRYSNDYIHNAQIFCDDVTASGILTAPPDMTVNDWLEANPTYREPFSERNGYMDPKTEESNQIFTIGFAPTCWYKAAYKAHYGTYCLAYIQEKIQFDVNKRLERIKHYEQYQEKIASNYRGINDLKQQAHDATVKEREAREKILEKYRTLTSGSFNELDVHTLIKFMVETEKWEA